MNGVLFRPGDVEGEATGEEMDEEEEEERGEHEDEFELVQSVFNDGLVVQVPCEGQHEKDDDEKETDMWVWERKVV